MTEETGYAILYASVKYSIPDLGDNMLKTEIRLNQDRILREGRYTEESLYAAIDKVFSKHGFGKSVLEDGTIVYSGNGKSSDYGTFGMIITGLKDKAWFMNYLDKWLWYNSDDGADENDFSIEDILYHYTKRASAA